MSSKTSLPIMYLVLRKDIATMPGWGVGPLVAQGAHAASACIWEHQNDPLVRDYMHESNINRMHKVVLGAKDENDLDSAIESLKQKMIDHRVWIEDGMKVCVAVKPMLREDIKPILKGFDLF